MDSEIIVYIGKLLQDIIDLKTNNNINKWIKQ